MRFPCALRDLHTAENGCERGVLRRAGIYAEPDSACAFRHMTDSHLFPDAAVRRAFNAVVIFPAAETIPHGLYTGRYLRRGPVGISVRGHNASEMLECFVLEFDRSLEPVLTVEINDYPALIKAAVAFMEFGFDNKAEVALIRSSLKHRRAVIPEMIVGSLPEIGMGICSYEDPVSFCLPAARLSCPFKTVGFHFRLLPLLLHHTALSSRTEQTFRSGRNITSGRMRQIPQAMHILETVRYINMDLQEIIKTYKKKTGASDADIAARTGVSRSTVTRWSGGTVRRVSGETMRRVSEMVGFNIEPVMKGMNISVRLPVLGYVKAGYDLFAEENYLGEEEASIEEAARGDYYLRVTGDSMNGVGILDGSLVLVRQCADVESGRIAVVLIGDEVTVKRVIKKENMMILEAANPDVSNRYFSAQEVRELPVTILGQVISAKTYY